MKSIIGLVHCEAAAHSVVEQLKGVGITEEQIRIISNPNATSKLLGCDPIGMIKNYTAWGAAISIGIYAIFGVAAALCQCNLMHYGQEYGMGTFLGAVLAGTFVGGFIGALIGVGEAEKDTHLYVQGVRLGGKVISIQVSGEDVKRVKQLLALENVTGVKTLQLEGA